MTAEESALYGELFGWREGDSLRPLATIAAQRAEVQDASLRDEAARLRYAANRWHLFLRARITEWYAEREEVSGEFQEDLTERCAAVAYAHGVVDTSLALGFRGNALKMVAWMKSAAEPYSNHPYYPADL